MYLCRYSFLGYDCSLHMLPATVMIKPFFWFLSINLRNMCWNQAAQTVPDSVFYHLHTSKPCTALNYESGSPVSSCPSGSTAPCPREWLINLCLDSCHTHCQQLVHSNLVTTTPQKHCPPCLLTGKALHLSPDLEWPIRHMTSTGPAMLNVWWTSLLCGSHPKRLLCRIVAIPDMVCKVHYALQSWVNNGSDFLRVGWHQALLLSLSQIQHVHPL